MAHDVAQWMVVWYFTFQISTWVLCSFAVCTIHFAKNLNRHATVKILLCVFVLTSFIYSLLLLTHDLTGEAPSYGLCVFQGAAVLAAPPAQAWASLALLAHVLSCIWNVFRSRPSANTVWSKMFAISLLTIPWAIPLILFIINLCIGLFTAQGKAQVARQSFYCTVNLDVLSTVNMMATAVPSVLAILIVVALGVLLALIRKRAAGSPHSRKNDMSFALRCIPFGIYLLIAAAISVAFIDDFANPKPDLFIATDGILAFILFGMQIDVLKTWRSWIFPKRYPLSSNSNLNSSSRSGGARGLGQASKSSFVRSGKDPFVTYPRPLNMEIGVTQSDTFEEEIDLSIHRIEKDPASINNLSPERPSLSPEYPPPLPLERVASSVPFTTEHKKAIQFYDW